METETVTLYRHPAWKRLYDELLPLLEVGRVFNYEWLRMMMGMDARSSEGRQQFYHCAREIAKKHQFQFENVRGKGYRIVAHEENNERMNARVGRARNRLCDGVFIGINTRLEELSAEGRAQNANILARLGRMTQELTRQRKQIRGMLAAPEQKRLPHPLRKEEEARPSQPN